jgi:hypothetical protein
VSVRIEGLPQAPIEKQVKPTLQQIIQEQGRRNETKSVPGNVNIDKINVLPQGRKTFIDIDTLAENIALLNLINPPLVARLGPEGTQDYLKTINSIWGITIDIDSLTAVEEGEETKYYILIAGERRYRACKKLESEPCQDHKGVSESGGCLSEHFPQGINVMILNNASPIDAIFRQASENTHLSIPPNEEAHYYDRLIRVIREEHPNYTLAQFARDVGRSEEKIRDAIRFCRLPVEIQNHVQRGFISYGMGVDIGRLFEAEAKQGDIDHYVRATLGGRYTASDLSKNVSAHLRNIRQGQGFVFSTEDLERMEEGNIRKIVEREMVNSVWVNIYYLQRLATLFNEGHLGKKDSPFSIAIPIKIYRALISLLEDIHPHLIDLVSEEEHNKMRDILNEQINTVDMLISMVPDTSN